MKERKKVNPPQHPLYRELPVEVVDLPPESVSSSTARSDVAHFLVKRLPSSEGCRVDDDLRKQNIDLSQREETSKKNAAITRKRKTGLSQKERRLLGLHRLPKTGIKYQEAMPMQKLWEGYMHRYLNLDNLEGKEWYDPKCGNLWDSISIALMKADYHGALLKVKHSKCHTLIGLEGIVIFDTKFTFTIVGKDNTSRIIPKQSCVFELLFKKYKFTIYGKYFCHRSNERATKKIKRPLIPML